MIEREDYPEYPFWSGTGFYAFFPPFDEIFFITARHCIYDGNDELKGKIKVSLRMDGISKEAVPFKSILETKYFEGSADFEDIAILVIGELPKEDKEILMKRSLRLQHQEDVEQIIELIMSIDGNIRTVGFPSVSKEIDYKNNKAESRPRGFHGKISGKGEFKNWYKFKSANWNDGELTGFSGSPILELIQVSPGKVMPVPIGIMVTESNFISINVATDLIAEYIKAEVLAINAKPEALPNNESVLNKVRNVQEITPFSPEELKPEQSA